MKSIFCLIVSFVCAFTWLSSAHAGDSQLEAARVTEARARTAFRTKRFAEAAAEFAKAFQLDPKANTKYNEGLAWGKAEQPAAEADALAEALAFGGLKEAIANKASERLRILESKLGKLHVSEPVGAQVSVAHADARSVPAVIHLAPGAYSLKIAYRDGSREERAITIVAAEETRVRLQPAAAKPVEPPEPAQEPGISALMVAGWSTVGAGAAALVATGVVGSLTLSKVSQYDDTGNTDVGLYDEAVTLKTTTNALVGVGGGLVLVGAVLLIVDALQDDSDAAASSTSPRVAAAGNGLLLRF